VTEFCILGPLDVRENGHAIDVGGGKQRALLALLLVGGGESISSDRLIDALWGEEAPASAASSLHAYVSRLRRVLGSDRLVRSGHGYQLVRHPDELDVDRFERLLGSGRDLLRAGEVERAAETLRTALALWRGPPLADFRYSDFAQAEIARLEERRLVANEERIEAELALGRHADLVSELESLVTEFPLRERPRGHLMLALYRSGRQAEALECYEEGRRFLVEELGIEPSAELRDLHRALLNQDVSLAVAPAPISAQQTPSLPAATNRLIGREDDLRALSELLLDEATLVTLSGAGGSGKTRLALEVARLLGAEFGQRVYFAPLAALRQPELLEGTILSTLGIAEVPGEEPLETLKRRVGGESVLLVLDNFAHLLEAAPVVSELRAACPRLKILVTSRAALHLTGEYEYGLEPLASRQAVALFTERAQAVRGDFAADEAALEAICVRLDCLPLALELAAARCRVLSPVELLGRLDHSLEVLTGGPRDLAARQQTLRATIEWSYRLLDPGEQQLFSRLAVFSGGCTFEAAERVCGASLEQLESLIDKSLLSWRETEAESRMWMLETIREFALELLETGNEADRMRRAHAAYYLWLAERWASDLDFGRADTLRALERELNNFRAAFVWASGNERGLSLRLAAALSASWHNRLQLVEGRRWFEAVLRERQPPSRELAVIVAELARLLLRLDERQDAAHCADRAVRLAEQLALPDVLSDALNTKAVLAKIAGADGEALELVERALAVARGQDRPKPLLRAFMNLSYLLAGEGRYAEALSVAEEGVTLSREIGSATGEQRLLHEVLAAQLSLGEWDAALRVAKRIEEMSSLGLWASSVPTLHALRGELGEARRALEAQADLADSEHAGMGASYSLEQAVVLRAEGRSQEALAAAMDAFKAEAFGERDPTVMAAFAVAVEAAFDIEAFGQVTQLLKWSEQLSPSARPGFVEAQSVRFASRFAARQGDATAVEPGFARAAVMFRELSMPFYLAITQLEHGEWLTAQARANDAQPLLEEAHETFARLGAKPYLKRTEQAQAQHATH